VAVSAAMVILLVLPAHPAYVTLFEYSDSIVGSGRFCRWQAAAKHGVGVPGLGFLSAQPADMLLRRR